MTDRATCWSITINNPTKEEVDAWTNISGWHMKGQFEEGGKNGTPHFQGMLRTPQVRVSAVKRIFPRAHIEIARDRAALAKYVSKEETRVATYEATGVPTIFEYQRKVADKWSWKDYEALQLLYPRLDLDDIAMKLVDNICSKMIMEGAIGLEFIGINPMWRSSWKRFYTSIIERNALSQRKEADNQAPGRECDNSLEESQGSQDDEACGVVCKEGAGDCQQKGGN